MCYLYTPAHSPLVKYRGKNLRIDHTAVWENLSPIIHAHADVCLCVREICFMVKLNYSWKFGREEEGEEERLLNENRIYYKLMDVGRAVLRVKISTNWHISKWERAHASIHMHLLLILYEMGLIQVIIYYTVHSIESHCLNSINAQIGCILLG